MENYLLKVDEGAGNNSFTTNHLITAKDRQMVKYHFHRTLKDGVYTDSQYDDNKHHLISKWSSTTAEIASIEKLTQTEANILSKFINYWTKL